MEIMHTAEVTEQGLALDLTPNMEFAHEATEPSFPDTLGSCALEFQACPHLPPPPFCLCWGLLEGEASSLAVWPPPHKVFTVLRLSLASHAGPTSFPASLSPLPTPIIPSNSSVLGL